MHTEKAVHVTVLRTSQKRTLISVFNVIRIRGPAADTQNVLDPRVKCVSE